MKRLYRHWLAGSALCAVITPLSAQQPRPVEPETVFPEPFSTVVGARELPDGRLMIADRLEQHVSVLDFSTGAMQTVGREGQGPGEYSTPMGLFPLPDGQTLLADMGNMRLSIIEANLRIGESFPMMRQDGGMMFIRPEGTDQRGRVYFSMSGVMMAGPGGPPTPPDSAAVIRFDPGADTFDTVAMLGLPKREDSGEPTQIRMEGGATFSVAGAMPAPFAPRDAWTVSDDGTVSVVRTAPYRVDRFGPDGTRVSGPPATYEPVRVTQAVKDRWADQRGSMQMSFQTSDGGSRTMRMERPDTDGIEFPEFLPPFEEGGVSAGRDGSTWVRLSMAPGGPVLYDVFDSSGSHVQRIQLPPRTGIVGHGDGVFYAVTADEDDLQWLGRYVVP